MWFSACHLTEVLETKRRQRLRVYPHICYLSFHWGRHIRNAASRLLFKTLSSIMPTQCRRAWISALTLVVTMICSSFTHSGLAFTKSSSSCGNSHSVHVKYRVSNRCSGSASL